MTAEIFVGMPSWLVRGARRRALREVDSVLLAALPPMPSEEPDDDVPSEVDSVAMPAVRTIGDLRLLIRRATQDPRVIPFAVKGAAKLGRVQDLPQDWLTGQVVHTHRRTVRLSDDGGTLAVTDVVGTDARRQALLDDPDEGTELTAETGAELAQLINPPEPPLRLRVTEVGARMIYEAAYGRKRGRR